MRIKNIKLKNFLSFTDINLDIVDSIDDPPVLYFIDGINYDSDDEDASNGSGKSALIGESVAFNIYGKPLRGTSHRLSLDEMIKYGSSEMNNCIEYFTTYSEEEDILTINRNKKVDFPSTLDILVNGDSKTKRTKRLSDKDIRTFINIPPEVFSQVIIYYRDNNNILAMNYGQKIEFFKKIIDISILDDYFYNIRDFKNINENFLNNLNLNLKNTEEIIDIVSKNKNVYNKYLLDKLSELEKNLVEAEKEEIKDVSKYEEKLILIKDKIKEIDVSINNCSGNIKYFRKNLDKLEKYIKNITSISGLECPTCKQTVSEDHVSSVITNYENEIIEFKKELDNSIQEKDKFNDKRKKLSNSIDKINDIITITNKENYIRNQNIKTIKIEISKIKKEINNFSNKDKNIDKNKYERRLEGIKKAIKIRSDWQEAAEYWYNMFAPKSLLRSAIMRKYVNILSDIFDSYISKLYNNEIIGKVEIDDDGQIDILLYKDNFDTNYWQMSSGERKRIDIAMILSLYEFTSYINPNIPKFLILDEIYDSLDQPGIRAVTEILLEVQQKFSIDIFIISHIPIPLDDIDESINIKHILVAKRDKTSYISNIEGD